MRASTARADPLARLGHVLRPAIGLEDQRGKRAVTREPLGHVSEETDERLPCIRVGQRVLRVCSQLQATLASNESSSSASLFG